MAQSKFKKKSGLGRGLGALLDESGDKGKSFIPSTSPKGSINEIDVAHIETNPWQPRTDFDKAALEELADSIKTQGIIQPITLRALSEKRFQLISGERRLQASKKAGLKKIPAYIRVADDQQMLEMALIENIQRENLNAIEIALSYQRLMAECDLKQEQLGERVGKNRSTVTNYLRLLKLPPEIQAALLDKKISMGHARALLSVENLSKQLLLFEKIINQDLSVRKVEQLAKEDDEKQPEAKKESKQNVELQSLQTKLTSHFGSKIAITANDDHKGEIKIPFASTEDLNRILEILSI
ncbi:MAG: ParB/RepB/Spo0J family partition protein [Bacteroidota bacterium]